MAKGKFLIAWHTGEGYLNYPSTKDGPDELILSPGVERVIDKRWLDDPNFARDVQNENVFTRWDDKVPPSARPEIDPGYELTASQRAIVHGLCYPEQVRETVWEVVEHRKRLGVGGISPAGVAVTKTMLKNEHAQVIRAALDLEGRLRKRPEVIERLSGELTQIEAL